MFDAVIFDLDGLLLDTERVYLRAGMELMAERGHVVPESVMRGLTGKDAETVVAVLQAHIGQPLDPVQMLRDWEIASDQLFQDGVPLRPDVLELLDALDEIGMPRAVATSSRRTRAEMKLARSGLAPRIHALVTRDCVMHPKPAPDPYLLAARRLGYAPARCLAFEDSDIGAEAAHRAGMTVVQVPDVLASDGPFAHLLAHSVLEGARGIGLLAPL